MHIKNLSNAAAPMILSIMRHPFNRQLATGDLPFEVFRNYIIQDYLYLAKLSSALRQISCRLLNHPETAADGHQLNNYADDLLATEQSMLSKYLLKENTVSFFHPPHRMTPVIHRYTSHLMHTAQTAPIPVAVGAALPCFLVYEQLGTKMNVSTYAQNHRYKKWIATYSGPRFVSTTAGMVHLLERHIQKNASSSQEKEAVTRAFVKSATFELAFFDSVCPRATENQRAHRDLNPLARIA
jgi:thiaminase